MRLFLFLLIFSTLYGGLHFYGFMKARIALSFGTGTSVSLGLFMIIMVFTPIIVHILERLGFEITGRLLAYFGYTWMGFLFLFFSASLATDICRFVDYVSQLILRRDSFGIFLYPRLLFFISLSLSLIITAYGFLEANDIRTEYIAIRTPKIPKELGTLKIVQVSDIHIGLIVREQRLKRILQKVKIADPDILVSTGDLVDGQIDNLLGLASMLSEIVPRYGKFAITGNHEFYAGLARALNFTQRAGFTILRGETSIVSGSIIIAGVDDPAGKYRGLYKDVSEKELLSRFPKDKFTLFLKHRPLIDKDAIGLFDLQLSGHAHKGQIFPFSLITKLYYPSNEGLFDLRNNSQLYVSRGSGTWGPPIRFLAPPEVTVIELIHGD